MDPTTPLTDDQQLAEAADEIPIEEYIRANNARDRGEDVPPLTTDAPTATVPSASPPEPSAPPSAGAPARAEMAAPGTEPRPRRHDPRAAVQTAVAKQREAERVADEARARLAQLEAQLRQPAAAHAPPPQAPPQAPPTPVYDGSDPNDPEPTLEHFAQQPDPYTARMEAHGAWNARRTFRAYAHAMQAEQRRVQNEQFYEARKAQLLQKVHEYEQIDPQFRDRMDPDVAQALRWSVPANNGYDIEYGTPLGELVARSDNPIGMMVYFSEHKQDLQRIAALHPLLQAEALGELRGRLAVASPQKAPRQPRIISRASPPVMPPVGGALNHDDEIDDADDLSEASVNRHIRRGNASELRHRHLRRLR